jgi:hypothetical protein
MSSEPALARRERALVELCAKLGPTRVGQRFGLDGIASFEDFRASVPVLDRARHEQEVDNLLGFGVIDDAEHGALELAGAARERNAVLELWRAWLGGAPPRRIALLLGQGHDPLAERTLRDDLRALGEELLHLDRADDPERVLERLRAFDPELLVVPSALTCAWLERARRRPLEHSLVSLRAVLCQHDLGRPIRSALPFATVGWFHRGLRCGIPSPRAPAEAVTLALGSQLLELLPYGNPEDDGRRVYAASTIVPEHAIVGHRYEVVCSSPLGLLRLRTEQHVRVVGFDAPTTELAVPRPRVVRLSTPPADVALEGCTVAGAWLTASVRQSLAREDPALVDAEIGADPQSLPRSVPRGGARASSALRIGEPFGETELGAATTRTNLQRSELGGRPRALLCRLELQGFVRRDLAGRLARRIDESLRLHSPAYAHLRERNELRPPRVLVVPSGTAAHAREHRIVELDAAVWQPDVRVVL